MASRENLALLLGGDDTPELVGEVVMLTTWSWTARSPCSTWRRPGSTPGPTRSSRSTSGSWTGYGAHIHTIRRANPDEPIPPEASAVHGIHDRDVCDRPGFEPYDRGLVTYLDSGDLGRLPMLGFDLRLRLAEFARYDIRFPRKGRHVIDLPEIFPRRNPRTLSAAYKGGLRAGAREGGAKGGGRRTGDGLILNAQVARHEELPPTVGERHDHLRDPAARDLGGMFARDADGVVAFARGKHKGMPPGHAARIKRDDLQGMLTSDFFPDTKELPQKALDGPRPG